MKRGHYAWAVCVACLLLFLCNMGLCSNILTVYLPFIEAKGVSDGMGSAILSVRCLFSFLTTFFLSVYYKKFSLRHGILLASIIGTLFPLVFCVAGSNPFIYYLGAILAGFAYGAGVIYPVSLLLSNWFHARRGFAIGLIADHTHEYKGSFVLFAVMMTLSLLILLWAYRKRATLTPVQ